MEDQALLKEITKNVNGYLLQNKSKEADQKFSKDRFFIKIEKLGGMCNKNYLVTVIEKNLNKTLFQLVYKKFGIMENIF